MHSTPSFSEQVVRWQMLGNLSGNWRSDSLGPGLTRPPLAALSLPRRTLLAPVERT